MVSKHVMHTFVGYVHVHVYCYFFFICLEHNMSTYGFFILVYISIGYPSVSRGGVPLDDLVRGHSGTPPGQRERGET